MDDTSSIETRQPSNPSALRPDEIDPLTPAQRALHRNFLASLDALHRDLVRAAYYLLQVRERRVYRLMGYTRLADYAAAEAGLSLNQCRDFLSLARRLPMFPDIEAAMRKGELSWSHARAICERAEPRDQRRWLAAAGTLSAARLERALRQVRAPEVPTASPAVTLASPAETSGLRTSASADSTAQVSLSALAAMAPAPPMPNAADVTAVPSPPASVALPSATPNHEPLSGTGVAPRATGHHLVSLRFTPEQYAHWQRLAESARRRGDLAGAVLDGLAGEHGPGGGAAAATLVVIMKCPTCGRADWPTSRGEIPVPRPALEAALCDAIREDDAGERRRTIAPRLRRLALQRARYRCERPGCGQAVFLQIHHRRPVAGAGGHTLDNLLVLCWRCHRALHQAEEAARAALESAP